MVLTFTQPFQHSWLALVGSQTCAGLTPLSDQPLRACPRQLCPELDVDGPSTAKLRYVLSTNDNQIPLYHRANNFTRMDLNVRCGGLLAWPRVP